MAIKNFFEKLVYLYKVSVDTIQQFGLGYFLRFGSGQLRKQKLDIFKPNEDYDEILSKKPIDKKTQYKLWNLIFQKTLQINQILKIQLVSYYLQTTIQKR